MSAPGPRRFARRLALAAALAALWGPAPAQTVPIDLRGEAVQGGLIEGRVEPGARVRHDGKPVKVAPDGRFVIGFARGAGPRSRLEVGLSDGRSFELALDVAQRAYETERIDGLPEALVSPGPEALERIARETALIEEVRGRDTATALFQTPFQWPVTGAVTGVYGNQRVLNGEPRAPHLGVDIAAPEGTRVLAPSEGLVALVREDMFFTGKTVILDHGHGLTSVYAHLALILVEEGEVVAPGTPIGAVGMSGRVTGPHLHWGVHLHEVGLDPALVAGAMPLGEAAGSGAGQDLGLTP